MEDSQLVELIRTLNPDEKNLARQLVQVDFFNSGKLKIYCPKLLDVLLKMAELPVDHSWNKEEIYQMVFGKESQIEGRLEKTMVEVHRVVKNALQIINYFSDSNDFNQQYDLAKIVQKKGLEKRYIQTINKLQKQLPTFESSDRQDLYQHFLLEYEIHNLDSFHNQAKGDLNVPNVLSTLELYLWITKLELINRMLLQQKVAKIEISGFDTILMDCRSMPPDLQNRSILIKLNYIIFSLLSKNNLESNDIQYLFDQLKQSNSKTPQQNLRGLYTYLRSICVLVYTGDMENPEINHILFELYKDNLNRGYLHYEGKLHPATYLAVCNNAIWVNQLEWAKWFTEKYQDIIIDENNTKDFYRLNMAACAFAQKNYNECLDLIPDSFTFVTHHLIAKRLNLKALYETQSDLLPYRLDNFKMYLARTSPKLLSDQKRQTNTDFLNLLVQLSTSIPGDAKRADTLIRRIKEKKQAAEWRWLMEKAEELKHRRS
jgi:hypothetical protein